MTTLKETIYTKGRDGYQAETMTVPNANGDAWQISTWKASGGVECTATKGKDDGRMFSYDMFGAKQVLYCEKSESLQKVLAGKGKFLKSNFLEVTSDEISHVNAIVMNPPFSEGVKHLLHAYAIAPKGCVISSLLNSSNLTNTYTKERQELATIVESYGQLIDLGDCFSTAERRTNVKVSLVTITKPGGSYEDEFSGFFMEDEPEEAQANGIMPYNAVRDLVNRYVAAVKIFDEQLAAAVKMNELTEGFFNSQLSMNVSKGETPIKRNDFKKEMQKSGWKYIFEKLDLTHNVTQGVRDTINKFVEEQTNVPFTMRNIYRMLDIIVGTREQTMDKALLEVFDKITTHHHDNRYHVDGWKTNSHFLVGKKFILPNMCYQDKRWYTGLKIECSFGGYFNFMEDMVKALCFITGDNYKKYGPLDNWIRYPYKAVTDNEVYFYRSMEDALSKKESLYEEGIQSEFLHAEPIYGEWFEWAYFRCKAFKKGSMHFEFKDLDLWGRFNQRIAKIKGFPLFEYKEQSKYQNRQTGRKDETKKEPKKATVLFTVKI